MKFCKHCGHQLPDDALFCTSCGTKVDSNNESSNATNLTSTTSYTYNPSGVSVTSNSKVNTSFHVAIIIILSIALCVSIISFIKTFTDQGMDELYQRYFFIFRNYDNPGQIFKVFLGLHRFFSVVGIGIKIVLLILSAKKKKYEEHFSVGLAVCILIFGSLIGGIIAFVERSKK